MPSSAMTLRAVALSAVMLGLSGCASTPDPPNPFRDEVNARDQTISIHVDNLDFNDATLHIVADGARSRLGTINGKQQGSFETAWPFSRDLQIHISLLASDEFTTARLTVNPGERVKLIIQRPIYRSYLIR